MDQSGLITKMSSADFDFAMSLVKDEGWNQTVKDWEILTGDPRNLCLVANWEGKPAGTATAINYSGEMVWIGMVLVKKEFRGRGISKLLLNEILNGMKYVPYIGLDATPAGKPVYERIDFSGQYTLFRMINPTLLSFIPPEPDALPQHAIPADLKEMVELDKIVFGADRTQLIEKLVKNSPGKSFKLVREGKICGFALGRAGGRYHQVGPVSAHSERDACILISHAMGELTGLPVVIDVPSDKNILLDWLESIGFSRQRPFYRMYLQGKKCSHRSDYEFAICGPEFG